MPQAWRSKGHTCACVCALTAPTTLGGEGGFEATPSTWEQLLTPEMQSLNHPTC